MFLNLVWIRVNKRSQGKADRTDKDKVGQDRRLKDRTGLGQERTGRRQERTGQETDGTGQCTDK